MCKPTAHAIKLMNIADCHYNTVHHVKHKIIVRPFNYSADSAESPTITGSNYSKINFPISIIIPNTRTHPLSTVSIKPDNRSQ